MNNKTESFKCPFCGYEGSLEWMSADRSPIIQEIQVIGAGRRVGRCPKCKSKDRERLVYAFLKEKVQEDRLKNARILHIAPEPNIQKWLQSISPNYIAGDAFLQNQEFIGEVKYMDISDTPFKDNQFDFVICNHVICDIKDDKKAAGEIYRILDHDGLAILQVPISKMISTVEYTNVQSKEDREKAYGYAYHERIYGNKDYINLLKGVGFHVEVHNYYEEFISYGINKKEDLYICVKDHI